MQVLPGLLEYQYRKCELCSSLGGRMKVKQLIETLKQFDKDLDIRFYFLENFNLEGCKVETILEADNQVEITVEKD